MIVPKSARMDRPAKNVDGLLTLVVSKLILAILVPHGNRLSDWQCLMVNRYVYGIPTRGSYTTRFGLLNGARLNSGS
jgi:hypothetical protein